MSGRFRRRLAGVAASAGRAVLDFAIPDACLHCGEPVSDGTRCLCGACMRAVHADPGCVALPVGSIHPDEGLDGQQTQADGHARTCAGPATALFSMPFTGPTRTLVHALKFGDRPDAVRLLAQPLAETLRRELSPRAVRSSVLVPVPLHHTRRRERGYDQTLLMARELQRILGSTVAEGLLVRIRATVPQSRLGRRARFDGVQGAFATRADRRARLRPAHRRRRTEGWPHRSHPFVGGQRTLILLDDVVTTGATMRAAEQALRGAGLTVRLAVACAGRLSPGTGRHPG